MPLSTLAPRLGPARRASKLALDMPSEIEALMTSCFGTSAAILKTPRETKRVRLLWLQHIEKFPSAPLVAVRKSNVTFPARGNDGHPSYARGSDASHPLSVRRSMFPGTSPVPFNVILARSPMRVA